MSMIANEGTQNGGRSARPTIEDSAMSQGTCAYYGCSNSRLPAEEHFDLRWSPPDSVVMLSLLA